MIMIDCDVQCMSDERYFAKKKPEDDLLKELGIAEELEEDDFKDAIWMVWSINIEHIEVIAPSRQSPGNVYVRVLSGMDFTVKGPIEDFRRRIKELTELPQCIEMGPDMTFFPGPNIEKFNSMADES